MKYKVNDRVRIKSLDWYNENKNQLGRVNCGSKSYTTEMCFFCGKTLTIQAIGLDFYLMEEDNLGYEFTDEMIECKVEEEEIEFTEEDKYWCDIMSESDPTTYVLPQGYQFKDENGNVINATKIVLEKKKKEYPKTYAECCKVMNYCCNPVATKTTHKEELIRKFQFLLLYRDAYWKIAGEEMGLGKPWKPEFGGECYYHISVANYKVDAKRGFNGLTNCTRNTTLAFPTEEMRDAFYENFKELIEQCKELL